MSKGTSWGVLRDNIIIDYKGHNEMGVQVEPETSKR